MTFKDIIKNDDAVSISIGFILMFAITIIIFISVVLSFYTLSHQSEKTAMEESFNVMGHRLAIEMTATDSIINMVNSFGGKANSIEYEFILPPSIAADTYSVNVTNSTRNIILESPDNGAKVIIPFNISTIFIERKFYSGAENYKFEYYGNNIDIKEQ